MSIPNRASKIAKAHKILKKHYRPYTVADRPVLEHLLYACCLESAMHEAADEAFAKLQQAYYDWNEVRVTTISELAEVMNCLPKASETASRLKRTLQSVFEAFYSFDLDGLRKENIGKSVKQLEQLNGVTPFAVAYVIQAGLSGHAIPISAGTLEMLRVIGIISDSEAEQQKVPGLERAIAKSRGVEFGSLLHQLGTDYGASPFSPRVRAIMLEIAPDAKDRFPKRTAKRAVAEGEAQAPAGEPQAAATGGTTPAKRDDSKTPDVKPKKSTPKKAAPKSSAGKKPPPEDTKKSATKRLSKRKPR